MKELLISRNKVKNFLSERLTRDVINMTEETIFSLIRYEGIGGYGKMSDNDLFVQMVEAIPEFDLLQMVNADQNNIVVTLKEEYATTEDDIMVDIVRIIQTKLN